MVASKYIISFMPNFVGYYLFTWFSQAEEGQLDYIARVVEMFETVDRELYFSAQWFFRAEDTVRFYLPSALHTFILLQVLLLISSLLLLLFFVFDMHRVYVLIDQLLSYHFFRLLKPKLILLTKEECFVQKWKMIIHWIALSQKSELFNFLQMYVYVIPSYLAVIQRCVCDFVYT